ncbi:MAG: glycoside hydrolase family 3 C-terminal domain-containing protein [Planctomycetaceae bacterium]|nr:glycoside hydrolase family 3 C-terminal domain-containing protein [Planctomycetaceae bacterium]
MKKITFVMFVLAVLSLSANGASLLSYDRQAKELLSKMTLEEKIGQMTQAENCYLKDINDISKFYLGSILSGGNADPKSGNSLDAWTNLYDTCQKQALRTRLAIPIFYGIDALHGHNNVLNAVIFPHNIGLGCTRDANLVGEIARITALEIRATGINWTFAPCVTVPQDIRWGRAYEGFSENTELVKILGQAQVRGYQGNDLSSPFSVLACAKHYIGDGGTKFGTSKHKNMLDQGDVQMSEEQLRKLFLSPYVAAVNAGVGSIMPSYSSFNGVKCSANKHLLTEILKDELGFEGFLISDYKAIKQITPDFNEAVKISINAGMDMAMEPNTYDQFFVTLKELVQNGDVPMSRIDDAVTRILRVKFAMGLMDKNKSVLADRELHKQFGIAEHRQIARQAVRQSLVLLKNGNSVLPLSKKIKRIHVGGKSADNIGNQCGGWTIDWQGQSGNVTTGGTTILQAIKNAVPDCNVTFALNASGTQGADLGIIVIGEKPYAEYYGDVAEPALDKQDVEAVVNMKKAGIPVVVILISGRPMLINNVLAQVDAFIAAWLPGTEGQGVADVLFGDYKPTGKLSFSWPKSASQIPLSEMKDKPLFEYGFGLSY